MNKPPTRISWGVHQAKTYEAGWLWGGGVAVVVFAARCREIQLYAGDVPYFDQWWVEARQILVPWLQGKLSWTAFFAPHHEHIPAWTRLLAWLQAVLLGRWDPQLQCTLNAALAGTVAGLWTNWLRRIVPLLPALLLSVLVVALAALPHGWENSTWGFQAHFPLALLFVTWHIHGSFAHEPFSVKWWLAQAAGLAAFFTLGTMWAAPTAVCATTLWSAAPDRRRWIAAGMLAAVGVALMLAARSVQPHSGAYALTAGSPQLFLAAFLLQAGWPAQWPGAAALVYFPALLLACDLWRNPRAESADHTVLALALWALAQAAALAYGRGSGFLGFVSRYGDLLALGVIANGFALWRLLHRHRTWRPLLAALALGWVFSFGQGLKWISTRAHTEYFHEHAAVWSLLRRDAVRQYLEKKDTGPLSSETVRNILYPDPAVVTAALDQPGLTPLLPVSLRAGGLRAPGDFISAAATHLRGMWPALAASGTLLFLLGAGLTLRHPVASVPMSPAPPGDAIRLPLVAFLSAVSGGMLLLWPMPLEFNSDRRWSRMLLPPDAITNLSFLITTPTTYQVDNLTGGAALWPEEFRNTFFGTHIDGPGFTGRAQSSSFPLGSPWLVIPFAGFPVSPGNSLRLQIEEPDGRVLAEIPCPGPNPREIDFWSVDVRAYTGKQARLVLYDGRTDSEGWLAVAPPQPARQAGQAGRLQHSWALERTVGALASLGVIFGSSLLLSVGLAIVRWRRAKIDYRATANPA